MPHCVLAQNKNFWSDVDPAYLLLAAAIVLAIVVVWALKQRNNRTLTVSSPDDSLRVKISQAGLLDLLRMACASHGGIENPRPSIRLDTENRVSPHVQFSLADDANLKEVQEQLKSRIRETLEKHLGQDQIGDIEFTVTGFRASTQSTTDGILSTESPVIPKPEQGENKKT